MPSKKFSVQIQSALVERVPQMNMLFADSDVYGGLKHTDMFQHMYSNGPLRCRLSVFHKHLSSL